MKFLERSIWNIDKLSIILQKWFLEISSKYKNQTNSEFKVVSSKKRIINSKTSSQAFRPVHHFLSLAIKETPVLFILWITGSVKTRYIWRTNNFRNGTSLICTKLAAVITSLICHVYVYIYIYTLYMNIHRSVHSSMINRSSRGSRESFILCWESHLVELTCKRETYLSLRDHLSNRRIQWEFIYTNFIATKIYSMSDLSDFTLLCGLLSSVMSITIYKHVQFYSY